VAQASLTLNQLGLLEISISEPAVERSTRLQIPVQQDTPIIVTEFPPPTDTPTGTPSPTITPIPSTATPTPTATPEQPPGGSDRVSGGDFVVMLLGLVAALVAGYRLGGAEARPRRGVRLALLGGLGVLVGYNFIALGLPGAAALLEGFGRLAPSVCVLLGGGLGLGAGWLWDRQRSLGS
jgi:hypothetical protein